MSILPKIISYINKRYLFVGCMLYAMIIFGDIVGANSDASSVMWHMPRHLNYVSLTFDDGPNTDVTPKILDVLKQKNVQATFFLVGHMIVRYPNVVRNIARAGHGIANHTWAHYRLDEMSKMQIASQISAPTHVLTDMEVSMLPYLRPPGGRFNDLVIEVANQQGLTLLMWDVNASDSNYNRSSDIINKVTSQLKPGSIILLHNSIRTVAVLPELIDKIHEMGFVIGPIIDDKLVGAL